MENEVVDATIEIVEVAAKKGILTMANGIKVMAVVGVGATLYHGYKTGVWLVHYGRQKMVEQAEKNGEALADAVIMAAKAAKAAKDAEDVKVAEPA